MKTPSEQSAKKPVSRIRDVPGLSSRGSSGLYQDPRFDTALGKADLRKARQNYQFLDQYRQSELEDLQKQLKTAAGDERQAIQKAIQSQRSRLETLKRRDEEAAIMARIGHKKISRAKKRELVLKERFEKMSSRDVSHAMERRRQKIAQKQKKNLPERRA